MADCRLRIAVDYRIKIGIKGAIGDHALQNYKMTKCIWIRIRSFLA